MRRRVRREGGLTYIELLAVAGILMVLAATVIPLLRWDEKRRREEQLRMSLQTIRDAIDLYHKYFSEGQIVQKDVDQMGYPLDLDELAEGVEITETEALEKTKKVFLKRIPVDPFTGRAEWGKRSYQDDWDSTSWGGENLYDVYSLSEMKALDGTYYKDW